MRRRGGGACSTMPRVMLRYAATVFLSAFLLFLVQPLLGKFILPWFGGGSGVWTACLLFFQCMLVAGYLYAHLLTSWFTPRQQLIMHVILLGGALLFLPIIPRDGFKPLDSSQPVLRIVVLLAATIGVPYIALSATAPLLQAWFARQLPTRSPWRLYALSNAGSLLALLGYPFIVEPALTRPMQAWLWSGGFVVFAVLCTWCAFGQRASPESPGAHADARRRSEAMSQPALLERLLWVMLPLCASIMLLAATMQLSEEVAPMPFVWVLPLATYLITFIIAFEWPRLYDRRLFVPLALASPWLILAVLINTHAGIGFQIALYLAALFACCMACHGETYRLRPDALRLTGYYLAIAFGGALGGVFVSIIAPLIFKSNIEIHLSMFAAIVLIGVCLWRDERSPLHRGAGLHAWIGGGLLMALSAFLVARAATALTRGATLMARSFYGSLIVRDSNVPETGIPIRRLFHGRICHGAQGVLAEHHAIPLMYYPPDSGIGIVMRLTSCGAASEVGGRRIAVVGLGVGAMAALGERGDLIRFYEINPQIEHIARRQFTFLNDTRAATEIVMGDARLSMEREQPQQYDIIVLDAFSGDAVPTHLLTREAFAVYARHLKSGGVIAVNVTNRYLELHPIVRRLGEDAGLRAALVQTVSRDLGVNTSAHWVVLTANNAILSQPAIAAANLSAGDDLSTMRLWTDDYCSLLQALRR